MSKTARSARSGVPAGPPAAGRGRTAVAGATAAALALGVSEFVAGLADGVPSLVLAVGTGVIDSAPPAVKNVAIAVLGTADKPALVAGIVVLAVAAGAVLGVAGARRFATAAVGFAAFGLLGALAAARDPRNVPGPTVLTAALAAAVGLAVLRWLLVLAAGGAEPDAAEGGVGPAEGGRSAGPAEPIGQRGDRRAFLQATAATGAAAVLSGWGGRYLTARARTDAARAAVELPSPARALARAPAGGGLDVRGLSPFYTPNDRFYRIDTALSVPQVDPDSWRLRVVGMVQRPYELSYQQLLELPQVEADITLSCVSNEVGGGLVGNARWLGVRLAEVLARAGVHPEATQVVGRSVDGFTVGFPTQAAIDGRDALVAVAMNGEPLPVAHGFPARLVVPGLYGYVSATKWLQELALTTWEGFDAYWVPRGWAKEGPVKTQSRIDVPRDGASLPAGRQPVAGVAWAPHRGIDRVEVQVDEGPWVQARLAGPGGVDTWRQWLVEWQAAPGRHTIRCRATDGLGQRQTQRRAPPAPDGATGWHTIRVAVR
ncbi:MAG TPA: molybdopterin-dependent oxidoreductase [Egibacteraceae bacterium]|nr:molybdopterin-dependent oxidoreductase [Egibacteraceae bacterium]